MNDSDSDLLRRYAENRCEASFTELVHRRIGLVFAAALRQVRGDRQLAEEVTQSVFSDLARKASSICARENLSGWLYTSTRYAATKRVQAEQRRVIRQQKLMVMQETPEGVQGPPASMAAEWDKLQPVLDEAMHELPESDRDAVLLRYFEGRGFGEVGSRLGVSEDAARMRVDRALEKLRKLLGKRGVVSTSSALATMLVHPSLTAAPAGLAATVAGTAIGGAVMTGATLTILNFMGMTKAKMVAAVVVIAGMSVPIVIQHKANSELQARNAELAGKMEALANEIEPLRKEHTRLAGLVAEKARAAERSSEVFKLRDEVTRLRADARVSGDDSLDPILRSLADRAAKLKQGITHMPEKTIPELQYLADQDWLDAVSRFEKLETEEDYRKALLELRNQGKNIVGEKFRTALRKFAEANNGLLPASIAELQPYFETPLDPAVIARYQLTQTSGHLADVPPKEHNLIVEIASAVDDEYDSRIQFGINGTTTSTYSRLSDVIEKAAVAYAETHNGRLPRDAAEMASFLPEPIEAERVQKFLGKIPPEITTLDQFKAVK